MGVRPQSKLAQNQNKIWKNTGPPRWWRAPSFWSSDFHWSIRFPRHTIHWWSFARLCEKHCHASLRRAILVVSLWLSGFVISVGGIRKSKYSQWSSEWPELKFHWPWFYAISWASWEPSYRQLFEKLPWSTSGELAATLKPCSNLKQTYLSQKASVICMHGRSAMEFFLRVSFHWSSSSSMAFSWVTSMYGPVWEFFVQWILFSTELTWKSFPSLVRTRCSTSFPTFPKTSFTKKFMIIASDFPALGLPAKGSSICSNAASISALTRFSWDVVCAVPLCGGALSRGFPCSLTGLCWIHVTAPIASCMNHPIRATQRLVKDVPPASGGIVHAKNRFLQSGSNVCWVTCFWWQLTHYHGSYYKTIFEGKLSWDQCEKDHRHHHSLGLESVEVPLVEMADVIAHAMHFRLRSRRCRRSTNQEEHQGHQRR